MSKTKFNLYHTSSINSENSNFAIELTNLTSESTSQNFIREYIRTLYKDSNFSKEEGKFILVSNAFVLSPSETLRAADASFLLKNGSIFAKVIGTCAAQGNGDAQVGQVTKYTIIGGSGKYKNVTGSVKQIFVTDLLRKLEFKINC